MHPQRLGNDLSEDQIRMLLTQKLRSSRSERLERYRRTGRLAMLASDEPVTTIERLHSVQIEEDVRGKWSGFIPSKRRLSERLLLAIEVIVILGFVWIFLNGLGLLRTLNRETASANALPTLSPTPLIRAVVLPSGHIPPTSPGGTRPNDDEIPKHLRPLVTSLANLPTPLPAPQYGIRIRIPALKVDAPILQGDGWEQLKQGVAQHLGTANPGKRGNMVLSGHNDVFGEVFRDLDQLKPGDEIIVYTQQGEYTYIVTGWELVDPDQVDVMDPTPEATITLISCYPYLIDKYRIIVKGRLSG